MELKKKKKNQIKSPNVVQLVPQLSPPRSIVQSRNYNRILMEDRRQMSARAHRHHPHAAHIEFEA